MSDATSAQVPGTHPVSGERKRGPEGFARVFVAAPMSAFGSDEEYRRSRAAVVSVVEHLKERHQVDWAYYAGAEIGSQAEFTEGKLALERDVDALEAADLFVLIYPHKVISSVLVEAGYALARRIPMLLLVRDKADLPYLFKEAERLAANTRFAPISIIEYEDTADLRHCLDAGLKALVLTGS